MKKYFEKNWLNPATNKKEKIEVHEYSLEDFEDGSLGYNVRVGKILERNSQTGSFNYYYLSPKEAIKIAEKRKEYYFEKVEVTFTVLKSLFDSKLSKTVNSAMLFETEIKTIEESLNTNKLYQKLVKDGRNFDLTNSPNSKSNSFGNDRDFIKLEAQSKFLKYLKLLFSNEIALKLIGLIGDYNRYNTSQPVYFYIDDILSEYKITAIEAKQIILKMRGSVSPDWNKNVIPFIIEHLGQLTPQQKEHKKDISKFEWLPIALKFAKGEMEKYYSINKKGTKGMKPEYTAPTIAKELGNEKYSKYILATMNDYKSDKNFYSDKKLKRIFEYCTANKIEMCEDFTHKFNSIKPF